MKQKGMTLLEVMIVIFLVGIIFLFTSKFFDEYSEKSNELGEYEQAKLLLFSEMTKEKKIYEDSLNYTEYENEILNTIDVLDVTYEVYSTVSDRTKNGTLNDVDGIVEIHMVVQWDSNKIEVKNYVSKK